MGVFNGDLGIVRSINTYPFSIICPKATSFPTSVTHFLARVTAVYKRLRFISILGPFSRGIKRLNNILQQYLNPKDEEKSEKEHGDLVFREGDKVMQIKNNYQLEWEIRSKYGVTAVYKRLRFISILGPFSRGITTAGYSLP